MLDKRAIVTGAAGFIGSNLVDHLLDNGYYVIGIDNLSSGKMENIQHQLNDSRFKFLKADITDIDLKNKIPTVDIIFHLAAIASVKISVDRPYYVNTVNVTGTINVLNIARELGVRRVVFSSSAAVYGNPNKIPVTEDVPVHAMSPYGASKIAGEQYMLSFRETYGIETVILRYFNVYGPRQEYSAYSGVISIFVNKALTGENLIIEGDGLQTRSFIHVNDVVEYTARAAETHGADGLIMNIAGKESIKIIDIAKQILKISGGHSKIIHGPPRPGDIRESIGSIDKAKAVLRYTPTVSFETGIRRTIDWYQETA